MQFLNPIWLLSGLGIIIPIAIHLWNQRPGKLLEVGSVRFLEPNTNKLSARLALTEILLLILRCLFILLLACFLAKPFWNNQQFSSNKGWLLIPAGFVKEAYQTYPATIDSLKNLGYEFHLLENEFPKADFNSELEKRGKKEMLNYWELGISAQKNAPQNISLWVFTPNIMSAYSGVRPISSGGLKWRVFPVKLDPLHEIVEAYQLSNDSVVVKMSNASMFGFAIHKLHLSIRNNKDKEFSFLDSAGKVYIKYQQQLAVLLDQSILKLVIYTDQFQQDANYLEAAIKAIVNFSERRIQWKQVSKVSDIPKDSDWLFWLSHLTPAQGLSKYLWYYQAGSISNVQSKIYPDRYLPSNGIALYKMISTASNRFSVDEIIWADGFGNPLLKKDAQQNYQLNTHFNPEWNDLVWSNQFPLWMMDIIFQNKNNHRISDIRQIDAKQAIPIFEQNKKIGHAAFNNQLQLQGIELSRMFWYLLCVLLVIERCVTYYQAKRKKNA